MASSSTFSCSTVRGRAEKWSVIKKRWVAFSKWLSYRMASSNTFSCSAVRGRGRRVACEKEVLGEKASFRASWYLRLPWELRKRVAGHCNIRQQQAQHGTAQCGSTA